MKHAIPWIIRLTSCAGHCLRKLDGNVFSAFSDVNYFACVFAISKLSKELPKQTHCSHEPKKVFQFPQHILSAGIFSSIAVCPRFPQNDSVFCCALCKKKAKHFHGTDNNEMCFSWCGFTGLAAESGKHKKCKTFVNRKLFPRLTGVRFYFQSPRRRRTFFFISAAPFS